MVRWAEEIEVRRGKHIAIVALSRKMAGIMYAIWRDGSTYNHSAEHRYQDPGRRMQ
jgi:transposase